MGNCWTKALVGALRNFFMVMALLTACISDVESRTREEFLVPIPKVLQPTSIDAAGDHYTIVQKTAVQQVLPGTSPTPILGYDGTWPGPTIVARRGRPSIVTQVNQLDRHTSTHNHGIKAEPQFDGHPADFIAPGKSKEYRYTNDQNASTYFYHDHAMGMTGRNIWWGMSGVYIIKDDIWDSFNFPSGEYDMPLVLQDRKFNGAEPTSSLGAPTGGASDMNLSYPALGGATGDVMCVNGACSHPRGAGVRLEVAQRKYLFRFVNASDERIYRLSFVPENFEAGQDEPSTPFWIVQSDGGLLPHAIKKKNVVIAPAERYGIVFDFSSYALGTTIALLNAEIQGPPLKQINNVMTFKVVRSAKDDSSDVAADLLPMDRYVEANADVRRTVEFSNYDADAADQAAGTGNVIFTMNGLEFDPARIDFRPKLGQSEVWEIRNPSIFNHELHVHLIQFQVLSVGGAEPSEEMLGWKDTVLVRPNQTVKIMMKWEGFPGVYVFHCHALTHEDHHMMLQMEVMP